VTRPAQTEECNVICPANMIVAMNPGECETWVTIPEVEVTGQELCKHVDTVFYSVHHFEQDGHRWTYRWCFLRTVRWGSPMRWTW